MFDHFARVWVELQPLISVLEVLCSVVSRADLAFVFHLGCFLFHLRTWMWHTTEAALVLPGASGFGW